MMLNEMKYKNGLNRDLNCFIQISFIKTLINNLHTLHLTLATLIANLVVATRRKTRQQLQVFVLSSVATHGREAVEWGENPFTITHASRQI